MSEVSCEHDAYRFEVRHSNESDRPGWVVTEVCGAEGCTATKQAVARKKSQKQARAKAHCEAQSRANAVGRAVDVRVFSKPRKRLVSYDTKWPESDVPDLVHIPNIEGKWLLVCSLLGVAAAVFILWQLTAPDTEESDWVDQLTTSLTVMASIVIAAAFTVASRIAVDHDGPWVARRIILARVAGLAVLGVILLGASFIAAFLPYDFVRYLAFAFSTIPVLLILWELVQTPRRLTKYAIEVRRKGLDT